MSRRVARLFKAALSLTLLTAAAGATAAWLPIPSTAIYLTGDSWREGSVTFRLYGVQACLRGTLFTNAHGLTRDCGEASLAMLIALVRDLRPQCYEAARLPAESTVLVICVASLGRGTGAGSRLDLGTALIATGYAFAAMTPEGSPVHPPYLAAQEVARGQATGLWAFPDLPDPNAIIRRSLTPPAAGALVQPERRNRP